MLVRLASRALVTKPLSTTTRRQLATASPLYQQPQTPTTSPFDTLDILPVQRPDTSAYFMSNPKYADLLSAITTMIQQNQLPAYNKCYFKRGKWIGRRAFETKHSIQMNTTQYTVLLEKLNQADSLIVRGEEKKRDIAAYLNQFRRGYVHEEVVTKKSGEEKEGVGKKKEKMIGSWKRGAMDHLGRWRAAGKRKQAVACAWIVPIEQTQAVDSADSVDSQMFSKIGQVLINGRPLPDYFVSSTDRESVLFPFTVTNKTGQFNVFVRVRGGGHTGQAEACQLAIARALYANNRKEHAAIRDAGLLFTDGRRVERKKTGKPKARKSYTWVKR
ncbi:37S ribosomal protein S9, mitochondrial [Coemansia erecta]|uniref:37S ribosomal protein S9, mitochondrial n=1 Tax=Coemansia asiatica TaxID=1052880 RepID=A0A9W7XGI1_9FUNG|nr:37S ribosomal protein S9, mitochondrial [Coemansia asiatica]KAJ2857727.1 37S ribosomal protein S9, mitochondrial [Coemansia erecta]KAJ2887903.1 37S ribosomal protein S9, mitochondrial [Coemansia asiatica]